MATADRKERERKLREEGILDAAQRVFLAKGYDAASMDEIAREAEFTKPTLYQYFLDKESLYLAVAERSLGMLRDALLENGSGGSAWERMERQASRLLAFAEEHPGLFRMTGALSQVRPDASTRRPRRDSLATFNDALFAEVETLLLEAQAEGSVDPGIDARLAACQLVFILTGFTTLWAQTGGTFSEHFGFEKAGFARGALGLILSGIRKRDTAAAGKDTEGGDA